MNRYFLRGTVNWEHKNRDCAEIIAHDAATACAMMTSGSDSLWTDVIELKLIAEDEAYSLCQYGMVLLYRSDGSDTPEVFDPPNVPQPRP